MDVLLVKKQTKRASPISRPRPRDRPLRFLWICLRAVSICFGMLPSSPLSLPNGLIFHLSQPPTQLLSHYLPPLPTKNRNLIKGSRVCPGAGARVPGQSVNLSYLRGKDRVSAAGEGGGLIGARISPDTCCSVIKKLHQTHRF